MLFNKYIVSVVCLLSIITYTGCKTPNTRVNQHKNKLPTTYATAKDSANSAHLKWKEYFTDKNLVSLIDTALKNNLDVLMTLQKIEIAKNDLRLSKGAMLPTVGANLAYLQRKFGYYTMDDAGNRITEIRPGEFIPTHLPDYFVGLQANWEIDIWGKLRGKKKAAFMRYLSSVEGSHLVTTNLIAEIANTYYELLSLDIELDIVEETIQLQKDALTVIKVQKQAGIANELAIKQFEAQVLNSQSFEFELLQKIKENENKINFLLGRFPQPIPREKSSFSSQLPKQVQEGIPSQLLENRPDIKQAEFELLASNWNVQSAKAAFYPSFNITGSLGFQSFNTSFLFTTPQSLAYNLLGSLTAPLINRSAIKAQFKTAKANQIEAMYKYQKAILNGYVEVANELSNIKNLEKTYTLKNEEVNALITSIDISSDLFKSGRATYFEVLMTQRTALESRIELVTTKKRQFNATVNIYKALGGGWR
ncbi:MAG: TolC family protein [Bacteroidetes bacterium]|nr:MAG: TolC family protein [Bacteroidota bacterium]